jgi:hypothetical protein
MLTSSDYFSSLHAILGHLGLCPRTERETIALSEE